VPKNDETVPRDVVIATDPAGKAPRDETVKLIVSDGPAPVVVQDVSGKTYDEATKVLQGQKLGAAPVEEFSDTVEAGKVIRTDPPAGQKAARDSVVSVVVSKGQDLVAVPSFKGLTIEQANAAATASGVQVQPQGVVSGGRKVRAQDVTANTQVKRGTVVTIFF